MAKMVQYICSHFRSWVLSNSLVEWANVQRRIAIAKRSSIYHIFTLIVLLLVVLLFNDLSIVFLCFVVHRIFTVGKQTQCEYYSSNVVLILRDLNFYLKSTHFLLSTCRILINLYQLWGLFRLMAGPTFNTDTCGWTNVHHSDLQAHSLT